VGAEALKPNEINSFVNIAQWAGRLYWMIPAEFFRSFSGRCFQLQIDGTTPTFVIVVLNEHGGQSATTPDKIS
jgi:hypothetical protein